MIGNDGRGSQNNVDEGRELIQLLFDDQADGFVKQFKEVVEGGVLNESYNKGTRVTFFLHFFYSIVAGLDEGIEIKDIGYKVNSDSLKVDFRFWKDGKEVIKKIELQTGDDYPNITVSSTGDLEENEIKCPSGREHIFEDLLEKISKKKETGDDVLKMFKYLGELFNHDRSRYGSSKEAAQQSFVFGFLMLHYKHKYKIDCKIEHSAGKGRSDLVFTLNNSAKDAVPILVEFKASDKTASDGIEQIKERGYLCDLDAVMKTESREAIIVGVNFIYKDEGERVKVQSEDIIRTENIIPKLLDLDKDTSASYEVEKLLRPLYYSIAGGGNNCAMSRVFAGQLQLQKECDEIVKYFSLYEDQNTTFVFVKSRSEGSIVINFIEDPGVSTRSGRVKKKIDFPPYLRCFAKLPVVKVDIVVDQTKEKFEDRFTVLVKKISEHKEHTNEGEHQAIKTSINVDKLITGSVLQLMKELESGLRRVRELISSESHFKSVMLGMFTSDKFMALSEYNGYGKGPMDILICFREEFVHALALELKIGNPGRAQQQLGEYLHGQKTPGLYLNWNSKKNELTCTDIRLGIKNNYTFLHLAAHCDNKGLVECLIRNGASVSAKDNNGATPFHYAAMDNALQVVKYFEEKYLKSKEEWMGCKNNNGATPFHYAAMDNALQVVKYFEEKYLKSKEEWMDCKNNDGATPFHYAAMNNALQVVKYLIDNGKVSVNILDKNDDKVLCDAIKNKTGIAEILIAAIIQGLKEKGVVIDNNISKNYLSVQDGKIKVLCFEEKKIVSWLKDIAKSENSEVTSNNQNRRDLSLNGISKESAGDKNSILPETGTVANVYNDGNNFDSNSKSSDREWEQVEGANMRKRSRVSDGSTQKPSESSDGEWEQVEGANMRKRSRVSDGSTQKPSEEKVAMNDLEQLPGKVDNKPETYLNDSTVDNQFKKLL